MVFAFSLPFVDSTTSHNFSHIFSGEISEGVYDVKVPFTTTLPNKTIVSIFCALVLAVTSNIVIIPQYVPNSAALSRAPPL